MDVDAPELDELGSIRDVITGHWADGRNALACQ